MVAKKISEATMPMPTRDAVNPTALVLRHLQQDRGARTDEIEGVETEECQEAEPWDEQEHVRQPSSRRRVGSKLQRADAVLLPAEARRQHSP